MTPTSIGFTRSVLIPSGDVLLLLIIEPLRGRKTQPAAEIKKRKEGRREEERKGGRQIGPIRLSFSTHHFQNSSLGRCLKWNDMNSNQETNLMIQGLFHFKVDLSSKRKHL